MARRFVVGMTLKVAKHDDGCATLVDGAAREALVTEPVSG